MRWRARHSIAKSIDSLAVTTRYPCDANYPNLRMCLVVIGWKVHSDFPLVVAANRDEIHTRATAVARFWDDCPDIFAGRDVESGGTWLGVTREGRFATVTNILHTDLRRADNLSRGNLVKDFLAGRESSAEYALRIQKCAWRYSPFNLLISDTRDLFWVGYVPQRSCKIIRLDSGIYGVSNHLLDTPWPKIVCAKKRFKIGLSTLPNHLPLRGLLQATDCEEMQQSQPDLDLATRKLMSSAFVISEAYGTRSSTVLTRSTAGRIFFEELTYDASGLETPFSRVSMEMGADVLGGAIYI